jgi:EAL domain-containing protein (putative c-di-GMP-specific phosphodiesterase class I)
MNEPVIYIIDDEPQTVQLLTDYVELTGYHARSYIDAVKFFEETDAAAEGSLIILDLNMPKMDGIEVMRQMVATGKSYPLILVSGYDSGVLHSAEQLAKAYSLDIIATLAKPFTFSHFKSIIEKFASKTDRRLLPRQKLAVTVSELEDALLYNQLILHYQPQINIKSGALVGVEALVRWQHPLHGLIYPDLFISLAENNGLIADLTAQVIRMAMNQVLLWKSCNLVISVSVNISADNITSLTLPDQLISMLDKRQLDPALLVLEVTESALMGQLVTSLDILTRLRMKGFKLSIDDFGTGYSSLSQLYRMPFTELKVDQSFVMNMIKDDEARGIVKTCISLGHELKMKVMAEGVEDLETLELLKEMNCDTAQGYYIARPMPAENILAWAENH